MLTCQQSDFNV